MLASVKLFFFNIMKVQLNNIPRRDNVSVCNFLPPPPHPLYTRANPVFGSELNDTIYMLSYRLHRIWQFLFLIGLFVGYWPPLRLTKHVRSGGRLTILWWRSWRRTHRDGFGTVPSVGTLSTLSQVEHSIGQMLLMFGIKIVSGQMTVVLVQILILLYSQS